MDFRSSSLAPEAGPFSLSWQQLQVREDSTQQIDHSGDFQVKGACNGQQCRRKSSCARLFLQ